MRPQTASFLSKDGRIVAGLLVLILALAAAAGGFFWHYACTPAVKAPATADQQQALCREVTVSGGAGINKVTILLTQQEMIKYPPLFKVLARVKTRHNPIKAGQYRLSPTLAPATILDMLTRGEVLLHRLTVPEGYTIVQTAQVVAQAGLANAADFIRVASDPKVAAAHGISGDTCEGYLFPETYFFQANVSAETIVDTMIRRFWAVFDEERRARAKELGFSVHQMVILASIIEKETGAASERPLIAAVFHNRLQKHMRLESDPTVIYGIKDFDGNLTRRHLETRTPYNTYRIKGLPHGPIANPGEHSIDAALHPADVPYIFFVAKKDGTHQFSTNITDHNRAVRKYQLGR